VASDGQKEHQFMAKLGAAMCAEQLLDGTTSWTTPKCVLSVTVRNGKFVAVGSYERDGDAFAFLMDKKIPRKKIIVSYEGSVTGRGVSFLKREHEEGTTPSILSSGELGYLVIESGLANAMEKSKSDKQESTYGSWVRN
jgi:hypothetical protein